MVNRDVIEEVLTKAIVVKCHSLDKFVREFMENRDKFYVENTSLEPIDIMGEVIDDEEEIMDWRGMKKDKYGRIYGALELKQDRIQKLGVSYTLEEYGGVTNYSSNDYKLVNGKAYDTDYYKDKIKESPALEDLTRDRIKQIDSAIKRSPPLAEDTVLYRYGHFDIDLNEGDVGKWKGYTSTSYQEETAERFKEGYEGKSEGRYKIKIFASKDTKGVLLNDTFETPTEHEWLLPRNTRYKVISVNHETKEAEVLIIPDDYY